MAHGRYFKMLFLSQVLYMIPVVLCWSFIFLALVAAGFSILDILVYRVVNYAVSVCALFLTRRYVIHRSMLIGFVGFAVVLAAIPYAHNLTHLLLIAVLDGFTFVHFWVPYNTVYFRISGRGASAYMAGLMFIVPPALGVLGPLIGGAIFDGWGVPPLFLIGSLVSAAGGLYYYRNLRLGELEVNLSDAWRAGSKIRSISVIQGFWQGVDWTCAPIATLYFFTSGFSYGGFLSVIAVFGAFSTLYLCRRSDDSGRRVEYLYPSIFMTAAATIMCAFTSDVVGWFIARSLVVFFISIANPFTMSVILDRMKDTAEAMYLREVLLNGGRAAGVMVIIACQLLIGRLEQAFIPAGILLLAYPLLVEYKKLYGERYASTAFSQQTVGAHD